MKKKTVTVGTEEKPCEQIKVKVASFIMFRDFRRQTKNHDVEKMMAQNDLL